MNDLKYKIPSISQLDVMAFRKIEGFPDFEEENPVRDRSRHNELAAAAVIGGIALLNAVVSYYFGKTRNDKMTLAVEVTRADGSSAHLSLDLSRSAHEPVDAQILSQIKAAMLG